jgi:type II secretory pathway predicted ATPase ExeA
MHPLSRDELQAMVDHALKVRGATQKLLADPARELLWRVSRGLPRQASKLLRHALVIAHERDHGFIDEDIMLGAIEALQLERPSENRATERAASPEKERCSRRSR